MARLASLLDMEPRAKNKTERTDSSELRGVVKRTAGRLVNDPKLEHEGEQEMDRGAQDRRRSAERDPDPHRRG